jgi:hypothetical protein
LLDKMSLYAQLLPAITRLSEPSPNRAYKLDLQTVREVRPLEIPE